MSIKTASKDMYGELTDSSRRGGLQTMWRWRSDTGVVSVHFLNSRVVWDFPRSLILPVVSGGTHFNMLLADLIEAPVTETEPKDRYTPSPPESSNPNGTIRFSYEPEHTYGSNGYDATSPNWAWNNAAKIVMHLMVKYS